MKNTSTILKNIFGYDSFRPLQKDIILTVLDKKDSLVIMPTGGGKSLCYQIPALIFDGLTVVISPLISLMRDQVEQLKQLGVNAVVLNSSLPPDIYRKNIDNIKNKSVKLLYIAPESLFKDEIISLLKSLQLDCITVDEAHCISEWGHDFRKDYRQLGKFRKNFPSAACIGLTATATPRVQNDIIKNLNLNQPQKFIASFNRENLFLQVVSKHNSFRQTVDFINDHPNQSGIIYCFSRKQVDSLHERLSGLGYQTKPYHAGLSDEERNRNQDLFIKDEIQIIIATIAFGMGINKSNVRFVLHHDLPKNIESYYQEIGRSGRDGIRSDCLLLFSYGDIAKINYFIDQKENDAERLAAKVHLDAIVKYAESEICRRNPLINYFGENYFIEMCGMCDNCRGEEKQSFDITIHTQKFLSAVKRTGEIYGANYIIDVLLGANNDRIFSNGHQNLSVYGIGKELSKREWQFLVHQLVRKNLLTRDIEFGSLKIAEKSYEVLQKNERVFGFIKEEKPAKKAPRVDGSYDHELFELLRAKRKDLADENNIPPYIIFSDKSLIQMATEFPQDEMSMLKINGVGINKLERFGGIFISLINRHCSGKNIISKKIGIKNSIIKKLRHVEVSELYNSGASIKKLAADYNVKEQTIFSHLFRYLNEGNKIRSEGLNELVSISETDQKKVFSEFKEEGTAVLSNIFEKLNKQFSYEELHLLRLLYLSENGNKKQTS